jgi:hypothetical protein
MEEKTYFTLQRAKLIHTGQYRGQWGGWEDVTTANSWVSSHTLEGIKPEYDTLVGLKNPTLKYRIMKVTIQKEEVLCS